MPREKKPERKSSDDQFRDRISRKTARRRRARSESGRGIWYGLGMMGLVGWTVAAPVLLAVVLGVWLDRMMDSGITWTLSLVFLGFGIGCLTAWRWVRRESSSEDEDASARWSAPKGSAESSSTDERKDA